MNIAKIKLILTYSLLLIAACTPLENQKTAAWIKDSGRSIYDGKFYITGVGEANSLTDADNAAKARIAEQIESKIESKIVTDQKLTNQQYEISTNKKVNIISEFDDFLATSIVKRSQEDNFFYSLAVLDKREFYKIIKGKITQHKTKFSQHFEEHKKLLQQNHLAAAMDELNLATLEVQEIDKQQNIYNKITPNTFGQATESKLLLSHFAKLQKRFKLTVNNAQKLIKLDELNPNLQISLMQSNGKSSDFLQLGLKHEINNKFKRNETITIVKNNKARIAIPKLRKGDINFKIGMSYLDFFLELKQHHIKFQTLESTTLFHKIKVEVDSKQVSGSNIQKSYTTANLNFDRHNYDYILTTEIKLATIPLVDSDILRASLTGNIYLTNRKNINFYNFNIADLKLKITALNQEQLIGKLNQKIPFIIESFIADFYQ